MKKVVKILAIALVAITLLFSTATVNPVFADDASSITKSIQGKSGGWAQQGSFTEIARKVTSALWVASIVIAVVVIMIVGIQFIMGSTQEKAKYKESLIPIVVGVLLVVFATTIVNILFSVNN